MELGDRDLDLLFFCAFRYALGRQTYIVKEVADLIEKCWQGIPEDTKELILKDLDRAIAVHDAQVQEGKRYPKLGMDCDRETWVDLYSKISEWTKQKN